MKPNQKISNQTFVIKNNIWNKFINFNQCIDDNLAPEINLELEWVKFYKQNQNIWLNN